MNNNRITLLASLLPLLIFISCSWGNRKDRSLIIPGKGAEGYSISQIIDDNITNHGKKKELFSTVLKVKSKYKLYFNQSIMSDRYILLLLDNAVKAIIITSVTDHVTTDAVKISRGKENFIINYGNRGLVPFRSKSNSLYYYPSLGIMVIDDLNDNTINMIIISSPEK